MGLRSGGWGARNEASKEELVDSMCIPAVTEVYMVQKSQML